VNKEHRAQPEREKTAPEYYGTRKRFEKGFLRLGESGSAYIKGKKKKKRNGRRNLKERKVLLLRKEKRKMKRCWGEGQQTSLGGGS